MKITKTKRVWLYAAIVMLLAGAGWILAANHQETRAPEQSTEQKQETEKDDERGGSQPVLKNIGFNLAPYNPQTNKAGDILFVDSVGSHYYNRILLEFGAKISGPSGTDTLPHPTYFLPQGTKLIAPVSGTVSELRRQPETNDYELTITPDGFSNWRVSFDHVINPEVAKNEKVEAGDFVATVAPPDSPAILEPLGWVELQVWEEPSFFGFRGNHTGTATCPFLLLEESVKQETADLLTQLADDWEEFLGADVYKQENWVFPGCLTERAST